MKSSEEAFLYERLEIDFGVIVVKRLRRLLSR